MNKNNIIKNNHHYLYLIAIIIASLFMCIGYATVNNVTLDFNGAVSVEAFKGLFIYDAVIDPTSNANVTGSEVELTYETMMQSKVILNDDVNSTLTMSVTVYNKSGEDVYYDDTVYSNDFYDNNNIDFVVSGISHGQKLSNNGNVTFNITFKYTDDYKSSNPTTFNNVLNSYINFSFKKGYSITYTGITMQSSYPTLVLDDENLSVTFTNDVPSDIKVVGTTTGTEYVKGTNYTYSNGVLVFNDVNENLEISKVGSAPVGEPEEEIIENNDGSTTTVTTVATESGEEVVVGYEIDTSGTNDGSITIPQEGIDTGILAFDGNDFEVTLKARLYYENCSKSICPIINISKKNETVNGVLVYESGHLTSGHGHNASGTNVDPYNKFRFNKYYNSSASTNVDFNIASKVSKSQMSARYGYNTSYSPLTVTFKLYCISGVFTAEMYDENDNLLAKPYKETSISFDSSDNLDDITVVLGDYDGIGDGVSYHHEFDILYFNVSKTIN